MADKFLDGYDGQTTDELLAMAKDYRIDSLVLAFEQALQNLEGERELSEEERFVLAIEALEREVNNGGYGQFFINSSNAHVSVIEAALRATGCPKAADITRDAVAALGLGATLSPAAAEAAALEENDARAAALSACDDRYFANDEAIADRLFTWIGANRQAIRIGG